MKIGVFAIQGDFNAHVRALLRIDADTIEVRRADDLNRVDGLILPGGESTTILKFIEEEQLAQPIANFALAGKSIFGTCAGAILLAREVYNPVQASLALLDITVERNAYGRQVDSFIAKTEMSQDNEPLEAVFIRAPRIVRVGSNVRVLARLEGEPVLVREQNIIAAVFHPELTDDTRVHRLFLDVVRAETEVKAAQMKF
jgi:pyridoxal 5'-phosphate synthase pdxT subunit